MLKSRACRFILVSCVLAVGVVGSGCSDSAVHEPEGPFLETSNERILNEKTYGPSGVESRLNEIRVREAGRYYYAGLINGTYEVGAIAATGQLGWHVPLESLWSVRRLVPLPHDLVGGADAVAWVGGVDTDADGSLEEGVLGSLGFGGAELETLSVARLGSRVWLSSAAIVDSLAMIAVGGMRTGDTYNPVIAEFDVETDGTLQMRSFVVLDEIQSQVFKNVAVDADRVTAEDFAFYVSGTRLRGDGESDEVIASLTGARTGEAQYQTAWTFDIQEQDGRAVTIRPGAFALHDDVIYFAGSREVEKDEPPADGGYWRAGMLGAVATDGAERWLKTVSVSTVWDEYAGIYVIGNALYATGVYGWSTTMESGRKHGFGWISVFDALTGKELHHIGLGNDAYASGFGSLVVDGDHAVCVGWSRYEVSDGGYQGWLVEADLSNLESSSPFELPGLEPVGDSGALRAGSPGTDRSAQGGPLPERR